NVAGAVGGGAVVLADALDADAAGAQLEEAVERLAHRRGAGVVHRRAGAAGAGGAADGSGGGAGAGVDAHGHEVGRRLEIGGGVAGIAGAGVAQVADGEIVAGGGGEVGRVVEDRKSVV